MKKQFLINLVLSVLWILAALALAHRIYSLRFNPPQNAILFWLPYIVLVSISAYISLTRHDNVPILVTIGLAFVLHSMNVLREPGNILWGKDAVHDLQIAAKGLAAGHFALGDPTNFSHAFDQSFYPGLEFLMSSLSLATKIPLSTLYNFTFVPLNLLTLLLFFLLMRMLFKNPQIANVSVLLYALAPLFNSFNSNALHESLAIIFFPLMMLGLLIEDSKTFRERRMLILVALSAILITITNEWTTYVLTFNAFVIVTAYYLTGGRKRSKLMLLLLVVTLLFSWLSFVAPFYMQRHTSLIEHIFVTLTSPDPNIVEPGRYSLPFMEYYLSYSGFGLLFVMSAVGIYTIARGGRRRFVENARVYVLMAWWIVNVGLAVIFQVIPWQNIGESPIRLRSMEFAYFGIAPFAALGIYRLTTLRVNYLKNLTKQARTIKITSLIIIVVIAIPTITVGFAKHAYDNPPTEGSYGYLYPVQAYFSSIWLKQYSESTKVIGTKDGETYVSGYAWKFFWYPQFKTSIQTHEILADTYYINSANVHIHDDTNFMIGEDNLIWLESHLSRTYDNGGTMILIENNQSQTP